MSICECCDPAAAAARDAALAADPTPPMGREPAVPGCGCRLCLPPPEGGLDAFDARSVRVVEKYGWQVTGVVGGSGPAFAYTVGLPHRTGHPELVMSGLDPALMHRCLNGLARRVLDGVRFTPGTAVEGVLDGVPVLLERLRPSALATTVTCSRRFHRRRVDALQVVWPDRAARFGWQPGVDASVRTRQPSSWRVPAGRTGTLAPDPVWPLATAPDTPAVACRHIVEDGQVPRCVVRHDDDGEDLWAFQCSVDHDLDDEEFTTAHLSHLVRSAPSVAELTELPAGLPAFRDGPDAPWQVTVTVPGGAFR